MASIRERIQNVLDQVVNVQLAMHGGSVVLTDYEDGVAWVRFTGACAGCMSVSDTLDLVVRQAIMEAVPDVRDVQQDVGVSEDMLDMARQILRGERP